MGSVHDINDSIAAIASPSGPAVRGVIRLSGPDIESALALCFVADEDSVVGADARTESEKTAAMLAGIRRATVISGRFRVDAPISDVMAQLIYWPNQRSYTRQKSAEIHCTGSPAVLDVLMRRLNRCGVRQAHPGEFTMRAFLAGRIDLTQAEAVLGVIDSRSEKEVETALKQLAGGLASQVDRVQDELLEVIAHLEAGLDFVEEDIEFISRERVEASIGDCLQILEQILAQIDFRMIKNQRPRVVLTGRPNSGKSCLQNALSGTGTALVSETAGTTRDYLVARANFAGIDVDLVDTAGTLQAATTDSQIELASQPIQVSSETQMESVLNAADLILVCMDGSRPLDSWEAGHLSNAICENDSEFAAPKILVQTKSDLPSHWQDHNVVSVSSESGAGLEQLARRVAHCLNLQTGDPDGEIVGATSFRCFESLRSARQESELALEYCQYGHGDEIVAAALRAVLDKLAVVSGKVFTDDILDRVFSRFCIGK